MNRNALRLTHLTSKAARLWSQRRHISQASQASQKVDNKAFTDTLLLPKTSFPLRVDLSNGEFRKKTSEDLYKWQWENNQGPLFVLHDGPPYANGHLHMGHALNKIIKDIINRYHVSLGQRVHYIPGWDCHGLPIENKALKDLGKSAHTLAPPEIRSAARRTALEQIDVQREEFQQLGIMADWGQSIEGKETGVYRTLDPAYEMRQLRVFQKMVEKGLIHRNHRPVYYSPSSRSALAEAELVYTDNHVSHSVYVSFQVDATPDLWARIPGMESCTAKVGLLVWTTTPWTLSANMGIAVNPNMIYSVLKRPKNNGADPSYSVVAQDRVDALQKYLEGYEEVATLAGKHLAGLSYLPLFTALHGSAPTVGLPIIPASHVTSDSGTGLVHCAPAHGAEDYAAFRSSGLLASGMVCHVDPIGAFSPEIADVMGAVAAEGLVGQAVLGEGNKAVVNLLRTMEEVLIGVERIKHRYPYDWKTGEPVIVTATSQWFANLEGIKEDAHLALKDVTFIPDISRNRLESFVRSRSEWCISRQRVWGVPIPALHHVPTDRVLLDTHSLSHILSVLDARGQGATYWWEGPVEEFLPPGIRETAQEGEWKKGMDTMDVWFDSGTSWALLEQFAASGEGWEGRKHFADVCLEGSDQHRGWFQSQLLTAVGCSDANGAASPYKTLITHGMVLDAKGKKMSKSIGNIVSPMTIICGGKDKKKEPAYGADALRFWAATVDYWSDMSIGPTVLNQAAESLRKIRNSARFILGNIGDEEGQRQFERVGRDKMGIAERHVMHELYRLEQVALEGYSSYNFPKVVNALSNFANVTLSSLYFDITKDCLYANDPNSLERRAVATVLEQILTTMTSIMAPIVPQLAEEVHHTTQGHGPSVFVKKWTPLSSEWDDPTTEQDMQVLLGVRSTVLGVIEQARSNKLLKSSLEAQVDIIVPHGVETSALALLRREKDFLKTLFIVSEVVVCDEVTLDTRPAEWVFTDILHLPGCNKDVTVRVRPSSLDKCPRCWTFTRHKHDTLCQRCDGVLER
ncbi:isoleucyl-tRNA synthetase [Athelia psychrophila]|uniref:isoleucine--tRNA ligase n=1 Tax=Athelia psychrophila TaxID=1759441 RepID=A0A166EMZ8_9AGAM|nr:isoleucyl-tRNA synthetase [Fibularhizoctonia sp. CBS 109695]